MSQDPIDLYERLPAFYRRRDAERGRPLRALLGLIAEQADVVKHDIEGLADDFFIETCAEWVVPYIGDLVGNNALHEAVRRRRADVAKTIYYRRRKGTLPMLEEMARDVTGWGVHAVDFFELLGWMQNLDHQRYRRAPNPDRRNPTAVDRVGTVHLRNLDALDRVDGPFDEVAHTVDIRPMSQNNGWHSLRKIGFFVWRLQQYPMEAVIPRPSATEGGFHFSPIGHPVPLFTNPESEDAPTGVATERHVPAPIRPFVFSKWKEAYYGEGKSLAIYEGKEAKPDKLVPAADIVCMDLDSWRSPPDGKVGVDVRRGRLAYPKDEAPDHLRVTYRYGFSADLGGGPYQRRASLSRVDANAFQVTVRKDPDTGEKASLQDALSAWDASGADRAVVTIADNGTYEEKIRRPLAGKHLVIRAANRKRPTVRFVDADSHLSELVVKDGEAAGRAVLRLNGLLVEGGVRVEADSGLERLELAHCTLVPGRERDESGDPVWPALPALLIEEGNASTRVDIDRCITGPLRCPKTMQELAVTDSIIDAPEGDPTRALRPVALSAETTGERYGPPATIERTTIFGETHLKQLTRASEVIFAGPVQVERRQAGCLRFSYAPDDVSKTPQRYRCQPDLALEARAEEVGKTVAALSASAKELVRARLTPAFTSVHYGDPGYAQLSVNGAEELRTGGAEDAEMGAFNHLHHPQRETNLQIRLEEYLPFGRTPDIIYVT